MAAGEVFLPSPHSTSLIHPNTICWLELAWDGYSWEEWTPAGSRVEGATVCVKCVIGVDREGQ
jgi:hypothetical protein